MFCINPSVNLKEILVLLCKSHYNPTLAARSYVFLYDCMSACNGFMIEINGFTHSLRTFLARAAHKARQTVSHQRPLPLRLAVFPFAGNE